MNACTFAIYVGKLEFMQREIVPLGAISVELLMVHNHVQHKDWSVKDVEIVQIHVLDVVRLVIILEIPAPVKLEMGRGFVEAMNSIQLGFIHLIVMRISEF